MDNSKQAVTLFNRHATAYQEKFMDVSLYSDVLDRFCDVLGDGASLLEVACGPGNLTKYLLSRRPDLTILATDLSPAMLVLAGRNNPAATIKQLDCRNIASLKDTYDGLVAGFCLPYLAVHEVGSFFRDASRLLKSGGHMYLSTMEAPYKSSGLQRRENGEELHQYFYESADLSRLLHSNNFGLKGIWRKAYTEKGKVLSTDLHIIAVKNAEDNEQTH